MINRCTLLIAILAGSIAALRPSLVQAQPTCDGAYCNYTGEANSHFFTGMTCTQGGGCRDCSDAPQGHIGCHAPGYTGECSTHASCDVSLHHDEDLLLSAVATGRAATIARLVAASSSFRFNAERQALQARNCKGALVSHIPLSKTLFKAVRAEAVHLTARGRSPIVSLGNDERALTAR